jgi:hypothetical protein
VISYDAVEQSEPAILIGLIASAVGFLVLDGAGFSTMHSAAVAAGGAGSQALLTRPFVYSPASIDRLKRRDGCMALLPELGRAGSEFRHPAEPAATIGAFTLLASFLIQFLAGVDMTEALVSSAGIAGVQTAATRSRVYSPVSARQVAAARLLPAASP